MNETLLIAIFVTGILALSGFGTWNGYRQWRRLRREQADLNVLNEFLANMPEGTFSDPRVGLENLDGVVRKRVDTLDGLKRRNGRLDFEAMSQISESQLTSGNAWIRYIAGVLILLGLFGTLIGLIGAVSGLSKTISTLNISDFADARKFEDSLKNFGTIGGSLVGTLGGMKTAFYASLFGVGTTILLTWMLSLLTRQQNEFLVALDEVTLTVLAPMYFPQEQTRSLDQFVTAVEQTAAIFEHFEKRFRAESFKAESSFGALKTLASTFTLFTESFKGDYENIQKELSGEIRTLQTTIAAREDNNAKMIETINNMATLSKDTLLQLQSVMNGFRQDIGANSADFKRQMEAFFERVVEGAFTESLKNFEKTVGTLQGLIANQEKATDALLLLQNYFHNEDRLGQTITQSSGKVESKVGESIKVLQEAMEKSAGDETALLNALVESTAKVENKVAESITVLQEALAQSTRNEATLLDLAKQAMASQKANGRILPSAGDDATAPIANGNAVALLQQIARQTQALNLLTEQLQSDGIRVRLAWSWPFRRLTQAFRRPPEPTALPPYTDKPDPYKIPNPTGEA